MSTTSSTTSSTAPSTAPEPRKTSSEIWGVVGYRHFTDRARFDREMAALVGERGPPKRVVSGGAAGADTMARDWARENNVAFVEHPPKTQTAVGFKARNSLIVRDSTLIVAFVSVKSRGTHDTLNKAALAEKGSIVIQID